MSLLPLFISLSLAAFAALVAGWIQHRNWRHQRWAKLRSDKAEAALKTIRAASRLIDYRLYRQRRLFWALLDGDKTKIESARKDYQKAVFEWMDNLGSIKAELWASFDWYLMAEFEREIHDSFAGIGRTLEHALRTGTLPQPKLTEAQLDRLGYDAHRFINYLLQKVASEDIRGLRGKYDISYENANNLTSLYLINRLFGAAIKDHAI